MQQTLEATKVKEIGTATPTAKVISDYLAGRERDRSSIHLGKLHLELIKTHKVVYSEFVDYWKALQSAGAGSIIYGRRGRPDRFELNYSLKTVASMVKMAPVKAVAAAPAPVAAPPPPKTQVIIKPAAGLTRRKLVDQIVSQNSKAAALSGDELVLLAKLLKRLAA